VISKGGKGVDLSGRVETIDMGADAAALVAPSEHHGVCANCGALLQGPWCHACGQSAEDFHRSAWRLLGEVFEGLFHFDGRIWKTLPDLFLRPGRLTRAYLDGHRASQVPPLRLFLIALLLVFFTGSVTGGDSGGEKVIRVHPDAQGHVISANITDLGKLTQQERAEARKALPQAGIELGGMRFKGADQWLEQRMARALDDPEKMRMAADQWAERFAFLMLPISAGLLSLLFVFQRRFFVFDHLIFTLHSLSAMGALLSLSFLLKPLVGHDADLILLGAPVHLFVHMRGVYGSSIIGALIRMALLALGSLFGFALLSVGLIAVALSAMGG
jgi:hypothetical protein